MKNLRVKEKVYTCNHEDWQAVGNLLMDDNLIDFEINQGIEELFDVNADKMRTCHKVEFNYKDNSKKSVYFTVKLIEKLEKLEIINRVE